MSATIEILPTLTTPKIRSGVREIVTGLRASRFSQFRIGMLKAFIDDSGSGGDSPWFVLAGYVGTVEGWDSFDSLWEAALQASPPIEYFKSVEANGLRDQFEGFSPQQRDEKIDSLIAVIGACAEMAICARMEQKDYNDLAKGYIPTRFDSPYYLLFPSIIAATVNIERITGASRPTEFVFDTDQRFERMAYEFVPQLMRGRSVAGGIVNVLFRDDRDFLPLQAADLLAWQIRRAYSNPDKPRTKHLDSALLCPRLEPHTLVLTRDMLKGAMDDLRERIDEFCRLTGKTFDPTTL